MTPERVAHLIAETSLVESTQISPDGEWIAYRVKHRGVESNTTQEQWFVQAVTRQSDAFDDPFPLPEGAGGVQWRPGTHTLSFIVSSESSKGTGGKSFVLFDVATRKLTPIPLQRSSEGEWEGQPSSTAISGSYKWSPRGRYVAFTVPVLTEGVGLDARRGVPVVQWPGSDFNRTSAGVFSWSRLFVIDTVTRAVAPLTPEAVKISDLCGFDWSPDERSLVATIDNEYNSFGINTDLIVVDRASGKVRSLVDRPGMDCHPVWSPDGRWVAFSTQHGEPDYPNGWPAAVPAAGGAVIAFPKATKGTPKKWLGDSSGFLYEIPWQMGIRLVRADLTTQEISAPLPLSTGELKLPFDDERSFSRDGGRMAYVRSAIDAPPELFVTDLDRLGRPVGAARQLTKLSPNFPLRDRVRIEQLSWPSPDGKFTIHGLLLTPASAWRGHQLIESLPTILYLTGGPSMVRQGFAQDGWNEARLPVAALGYAVLVPNTRGRGGYGDAFVAGIATSKSQLQAPFADAMAGIDELIRRGVADPERLGIMGHSYGGDLTSYAIAQTNRFQAAVMHEGGVADLINYFYPYKPGSWRALLVRNLFGVHDPFDPAERARLVAESPALHGEKIKTPTLLIFGAAAAANQTGRPFHSVLRHYKVPSAFFVYDEGHVFERPAAVADDLTRTIEWLDHWVRGTPYPNRERAEQYEQWKTEDELHGDEIVMKH